MPKISTTIQLPKNVMDDLNKYKADSGVSKNVIVERSLRALFEGRIFDLPDDLMAYLRRVEEEWGTTSSFIIEKALRIFIAEDIETKIKSERKR